MQTDPIEALRQNVESMLDAMDDYKLKMKKTYDQIEREQSDLNEMEKDVKNNKLRYLDTIFKYENAISDTQLTIDAYLKAIDKLSGK